MYSYAVIWVKISFLFTKKSAFSGSMYRNPFAKFIIKILCMQQNGKNLIKEKLLIQAISTTIKNFVKEN